MHEAGMPTWHSDKRVSHMGNALFSCRAHSITRKFLILFRKNYVFKCYNSTYEWKVIPWALFLCLELLKHWKKAQHGILWQYFIEFDDNVDTSASPVRLIQYRSRNLYFVAHDRAPGTSSTPITYINDC